MNDFTTSNAAPANTNCGEERTVERHGAVIRYENLECFGKVEIGLCALVSPGDKVVVYGVNHNHVNGPQLVDRSFAMGDVATYGGRNIDYTGVREAMKFFPFRIVGVNPDTGRAGYLGGARTREAAEKRARGYTNSKHVIRKWAPLRVLTDAEFQAERAAGPLECNQ